MPEYDIQEQELVRRLDVRLMPVLALLYLASVVDRGTQFHARITHHASGAGVRHDIKTDDGGFVLALVAYGIASFIFVMPSTFGFRKYGPARWFGAMVMGWGLVTACSAATNNMAGWVVTKVVLGALQAGFLPGLMLYILSFYTREEWATRMSWVVSSATIAVSFLGVFADWGSQFDGTKGLQTWRWMFVCTGILSMVAGGAALFFLPSYPETCAFLTPADRVLAVARGHDGSEGGGGHESDDDAHRIGSSIHKPKPPRIKFAMGQFIEALMDLRNWLFAASFCFISITMDVLITLGPQVAATSFSLTSQFLQKNADDPDSIADAIEDVENGTRHARMVAAIPYLVGGITAFICAWHSDRTGDRALHATIPLLISSIGFATLAFIPVSLSGAGPWRYFLGLLPATAGVVAAFPCLLSYALDKAQGDTNRVSVAAITFSFGQAFSQAVASPGSLLLSDASSTSIHAVGAGVCACGICFSAFCVLLIRWMYRREETQMWGKGPGLRRLLNDADEGKAWDVELSQADVFMDQKKPMNKHRKASGFWADDNEAKNDSDWDLQEYASR
ncbi:hypothetical protein PhCBS80983_g03777 [Powellomyces hirtus]|uniref:Major facilitator superfamily (MFS) profile domain-containing protein n=1 Tax=Powellomyces hirtus TaxID=109895 RepID=A0A507E341_9FUNG|nr:major facilitator superfamily domain-containing protein [Powellomyces hirtus]TPX57520.1 hypothetical protein PhCBS80983_g03777 [Powellomyces hirtus]